MNFGNEMGSKLIQGVTINVVSGPIQAISCANLTFRISTLILPYANIYRDHHSELWQTSKRIMTIVIQLQSNVEDEFQIPWEYLGMGGRATVHISLLISYH